MGPQVKAKLEYRIHLLLANRNPAARDPVAVNHIRAAVNQHQGSVCQKPRRRSVIRPFSFSELGGGRLKVRNLELPWTALGVAFELGLGLGRGRDGDGDGVSGR